MIGRYDTVQIVNPKDASDPLPQTANLADAIRNGWTLWADRATRQHSQPPAPAEDLPVADEDSEREALTSKLRDAGVSLRGRPRLETLRTKVAQIGSDGGDD